MSFITTMALGPLGAAQVDATVLFVTPEVTIVLTVLLL
jgi:hypothetical protein